MNTMHEYYVTLKIDLNNDEQPLLHTVTIKARSIDEVYEKVGYLSKKEKEQLIIDAIGVSYSTEYIDIDIYQVD
jgi:uncharacterized lipoprotein YehR (DUF1307 family)